MKEVHRATEGTGHEHDHVPALSVSDKKGSSLELGGTVSPVLPGSGPDAQDGQPPPGSAGEPAGLPPFITKYLERMGEDRDDGYWSVLRALKQMTF